MDKILDFDPIDKFGEPTVKVLGQQTDNVKLASSDAYAPEIREFIQSLKPVVGKLYALINAMGATEYFSCNRNGDAFYEDALKKYHHTFVEDGHAYMHHKNKDPNKSYGRVIFSAYNDKMHRVELIVEYDTDKLDKKFVDKINNGEMVNVSMGCRVDADYCSICGHKAKTPAEYCEHLISNPGLTRMLPDGRKAFAINRDPHFFDISIVTIPADPTARVMAKIAGGDTIISSVDRAKEEFGEQKTAGFEKTASGDVKSLDMSPTVVTKESEPEVLSTEDGKISDCMDKLIDTFDRFMGPDIPADILDDIAGHFPNPLDLLHSFIARKIFLRPRETQRIILVSKGRKDLADELDNRHIVCMSDPDLGLSEFMDSFCAPKTLPADLPADILEARSLTPDNIKKVTIRIVLNPDDCCEKTSGVRAIPVEMSDDFKYLLGRDPSSEVYDFQQTSPAADEIVTYGILGSLIAAMNTLLSRNVPTAALLPLNAAAIAVGPSAIKASRKLTGAVADAVLPEEGFSRALRSVNTPVQEMMFMNPNSPKAVEAALADALIKAQNRVKLSSLNTENRHWTPKALLALPVLYGATKLASYSDITNTKVTTSLPISYATILKFAGARKAAVEFVKSVKKSCIPMTNMEKRLENILFTN